MALLIPETQQNNPDELNHSNTYTPKQLTSLFTSIIYEILILLNRSKSKRN